jgi:uncharacterized protein YcgI (DUF1989 family)
VKVLFDDPRGAGAGREFYRRLAEAEDRRTLIDEFVIPARSGEAWPVRRGQVCRMSIIAGPQAGDFNAWNLHNPREHFWAARTRMMEGTHVTAYNRLWSTRPYHRPMLTLIRDTFPTTATRAGGRCHDLLGSGCDPFMWKLVNGEDFDRTCYNNLTRAIAPHHLAEFDVHDVLNLFQITGLDPETGLFFTEPSPGSKGDHVEFVAEIDLLCAMSACPAGDISVPHLGPDRGDPAPTCKPLGIAVYEVDPELLEGQPRSDPVDAPPVYGTTSPRSS